MNAKEHVMLSNAKHLGTARARFFRVFRMTDQIVLHNGKRVILSEARIWFTRERDSSFHSE